MAEQADTSLLCPLQCNREKKGQGGKEEKGKEKKEREGKKEQASLQLPFLSFLNSLCWLSSRLASGSGGFVR